MVDYGWLVADALLQTPCMTEGWFWVLVPLAGVPCLCCSVPNEWPAVLLWPCASVKVCAVR